MLRLILAGVLFVVSATCVAWPEDVSNQHQDRENWMGYMSAVIANNRSVRNYDVRITVKYLTSHPDGQTDNFRFTSRYLHDRDSHRYLCASVEDREVVMGKKPPANFRTVWGASFEEGKQARIIKDGALENVAFTDVGAYRRLVQWPNLLLVGVKSYPVISDDEEAEILNWRAAASKHEYQVEVIDGDGPDVKTSVTRQTQDKIFVRTHFVFDRDTFVPKSRTVEIIPRVETNRYILQSERFRWEERDGIMIPVAINKESIRSIEKGDGTYERYVVYRDVTFEWVSVNGDTKPGAYDLQRFDKMKDLLKFVDPDKATSSDTK